MKILAIDRSTGSPDAALAVGGLVHRMDPADGFRASAWPALLRDFLAGFDVAFDDLDRIVVGTGPGSFAGIRAAIAFAFGLELGIETMRPGGSGPVVYGMPSPAGMSRDDRVTAVVGDARRGLFWVAVYDGGEPASEIRLAKEEDLHAGVPASAIVVTPDGSRIGDRLGAIFETRYLGGGAPSAERMAHIALRRPEMLVPAPAPIYLSPAVRA